MDIFSSKNINLTFTNNNFTRENGRVPTSSNLNKNTNITDTDENITGAQTDVSLSVYNYTNVTLNFEKNIIIGGSYALYLLNNAFNSIGATSSTLSTIYFTTVTTCFDIFISSKNIFADTTSSYDINFGSVSDSFGNITINYNRVLIGNYDFYAPNNTNIDVNYNWWSNNTPKIGGGKTLNNWFVMVLSAYKFCTITNSSVNRLNSVILA